MMELARHLDATREHLEPLVRDTGQISASVAQLEETTTTLAEAVAPLQGASERVGRLMDRLPERRNKS
jgi:hypothetical protein